MVNSELLCRVDCWRKKPKRRDFEVPQEADEEGEKASITIIRKDAEGRVGGSKAGGDRVTKESFEGGKWTISSEVTDRRAHIEADFEFKRVK